MQINKNIIQITDKYPQHVIVKLKFFIVMQ